MLVGRLEIPWRTLPDARLETILRLQSITTFVLMSLDKLVRASRDNSLLAPLGNG